MRSVHIPNSKLTEGETYPFLILKFVTLEPGDDWMVLQEPRGYKILVPLNYYTSYGFKPGQTVLCRVDKINCNGRMFLEPRHPVYEEGKVYEFDVIEKKYRVGITDETELFFEVSDALGSRWQVYTRRRHLWDHPPDRLKCLVRRIKKGNLFLEIEGEELKRSRLEAGKLYSFQVVDEKFHPDDGYYYYILADQWGGKHLLRKKYYTAYHIRQGSEIRCRVDKLTSEGYYALEPEHPCYTIGKTYEFNVGRLEELVFTDGFRQNVMVLKDCFNEEIKVHIDDDQVTLLAECKKHKAKVQRISKSRLEVELVGQLPNEN